MSKVGDKINNTSKIMGAQRNELVGDRELEERKKIAQQQMLKVQPDVYRGLAGEAARRQKTAAAQFGEDKAQQLAARAQQLSAIERIGAAPSVVDQQAMQGRAALARGLASQLASTPGGFSPAAARAALLARGQGQAQLEGAAAVGKAQEQRATAEAQLAGLGQVRAGDFTQSGLTVQQDEALRRGLAGRAAITGAADQTAMGLDARATQREAMLRGDFMDAMGLEYGQPASPGVWEQIGALGGTIGGIAPTLIGLSDERAKTNIKSGEDSVEKLLDHIQGYSYEYKDPSIPGAAPGRQHGVMAQDLEKSEIGRAMVVIGDDGYRRVDYSPQKIGPLALSGMSNLNRRIRRLEKRL